MVSRFSSYPNCRVCTALLMCISLLLAHASTARAQEEVDTPVESSTLVGPSLSPPMISTQHDWTCVCDQCIGDIDSDCCFVPCGTRYWASTELLLWWRKGIDLPVLVTDNDPVPNILFGGESVGGGVQAGGRLNIGTWFSGAQTEGVGATFYGTGQQTVNFDSANTGSAVVVRPAPGGGVLVVHDPAGVGNIGNVVAQTTSETLGADVHYRRLILGDGPNRLDFLGGYQMSRIDEALTVRHQFTDLGGTVFDGTDRFFTKNEFHGVQLGMLAQYRGPRTSIELLAKLGLGNMRQKVIVGGSDVSRLGSDASLLAATSNAGIRSQNDFTAVRELGIKCGYRVYENVEIGAGYSFIHWKHVVQPGDQIDLNALNPRPIFTQNSYYVHGLNFILTIEL